MIYDYLGTARFCWHWLLLEWQIKFQHAHFQLDNFIFFSSHCAKIQAYSVSSFRSLSKLNVVSKKLREVYTCMLWALWKKIGLNIYHAAMSVHYIWNRLETSMQEWTILFLVEYQGTENIEIHGILAMQGTMTAATNSEVCQCNLDLWRWNTKLPSFLSI